MLVSPTIWPKDPVEADYLHAARTLGIPTIGYVNSWDNLTSKGTIHVVPDLYIVWNEPIALEAVEIHDVPRPTVRITGAPHLDMFFSLRPQRDRAQLCAEMGCADAPYMVFLCSSRTICENEVPMVKAMADALARGALPSEGLRHDRHRRSSCVHIRQSGRSKTSRIQASLSTEEAIGRLRRPRGMNLRPALSRGVRIRLTRPRFWRPARHRPCYDLSDEYCWPIDSPATSPLLSASSRCAPDMADLAAHLLAILVAPTTSCRRRGSHAGSFVPAPGHARRCRCRVNRDGGAASVVERRSR